MGVPEPSSINLSHPVALFQARSLSKKFSTSCALSLALGLPCMALISC